MHWEDYVLEGQASTLHRIRQQLQQASRQRTPLLLCGEPGCGLEWLAQGVYMESPFAPLPLFRIDCRMPSSLALLLGGPSFQGWSLLSPQTSTVILLERPETLDAQQQARIRQAHQSAQTPWLWLLATSYTVHGQPHQIPALAAALGTQAITLPALRERKEDIVPLLFKILQTLCAPKEPPGITPGAQRLLSQYRWPLNVAELFQCAQTLHQRDNTQPVTKAVVCEAVPGSRELAEASSWGQMTLEEVFTQKMQEFVGLLGPELSSVDDLYKRLLPYFERPILREILDYTDGNQLQAAQILGLNRNTLRKKCSQLDLHPQQFRPKQRSKHTKSD